jgi:predicted lipoprotein with Yx(FWY)xxD motif
MKRIALGLSAAILFTGLSAGIAFAAGPDTTYQDTSAGKVLADSKGMTLYVFDNDAKGATMSACTGKCIVNWPPFLAPADATASGDWTVVDGKDKDGNAIKLWAYEGQPLYYWVNDKKPGDVDGDGKGGVWHVVKQD